MSISPKVIHAVETMEGEMVSVKRLFPVAGLRNYDPFVLLDHFDIRPGSGFPAHPHRGFEAITYLFSGCMAHEDNLGNNSIVGPGGAQRFSAGKGIIHSEMPDGKERSVGIQLWINLPKRLKQIDADYQAASADQIITQEFTDNVGKKITRRNITGKYGPIKLQTPVEYFDLTIEAGGSYHWTPPKDHNGLVYIVDGSIHIHNTRLSPGNAILLDNSEELNIAANENCRLMVCFGQPHHEPILQRGTFVD